MIPETFRMLTRQAEEAFVLGELEEAYELLRRSEEQAMRDGLHDLADQAFCRRCYLLLESESLDHESKLPRLQEILLRSRDPNTRWMAAHYTALSYYHRGEFDRAICYGKRALTIAEQAGDDSRAAASINLFGTIAAQTSRFDEAEEALKRAIKLYTVDDGDLSRLMKAQLHDNLGYIFLCTGRLEEGIGQCLTAKLLVEGLGAERFLPQILQDLCFGYLQLGQLAEARQHGDLGLELAIACDQNLIIKNLCWLLAEISMRSGDHEHARFLMTYLTRFFPDMPEGEDIISLLLGVDLTQVVNLRG